MLSIFHILFTSIFVLGVPHVHLMSAHILCAQLMGRHKLTARAGMLFTPTTLLWNMVVKVSRYRYTIAALLNVVGGRKTKMMKKLEICWKSYTGVLFSSNIFVYKHLNGLGNTLNPKK